MFSNSQPHEFLELFIANEKDRGRWYDFDTSSLESHIETKYATLVVYLTHEVHYSVVLMLVLQAIQLKSSSNQVEWIAACDGCQPCYSTADSVED